MKGFFIGLSKLVLGIAIALMLLSMAGVATARYFMGRLSVLPPKPIYEDETPVAPAVADRHTDRREDDRKTDRNARVSTLEQDWQAHLPKSIRTRQFPDSREIAAATRPDQIQTSGQLLQAWPLK